jgi:hypothetical protein
MKAQAVGRTVGRAGVSLIEAILIFAGAVAIGFGVPFVWLAIGSIIEGSSSRLHPETAAFVGTGIIFTYWALMFVAAWLRARFLPPAQIGPRRQSWNRSMRDAPFKPGRGKSDPIEALFVTTTLLVGGATTIWFFFFAGSSIPSA